MKTISSGEYIRTGGVKCPRCKDEYQMEGSSVHIAEGIAWQNMTCNACKLDWTDEYTLTSIDNAWDGDNEVAITD